MDTFHMPASHTHEGQPRPTILMVGAIPPTRMAINLGSLRNGGFFRLFNVSPEIAGRSATEGIEKAIRKHKPRAIMLRPAAFPRNVCRSVFDDFPHDVFIGNLGTGVDHLDGLRDHPKVKFITPSGKNIQRPASGPISVAELTVFLAKCLRRPLHDAALLGRHADPLHFHNQHEALLNARLLRGAQWLCLGAGNQVRALLPLLKAYGVKKATVWNPRGNWDGTRIAKLLSEMPPVSVVGGESNFTATFGSRFQIEGVTDYTTAASIADVVSIHVGGNSLNNPPVYVDSRFLALLKASAHLINVSRGHLVDEPSVVAALLSGLLGGFATDVISHKAETNKEPKESPIWELFQQSQSGLAALKKGHGQPNLVVLPHVGGSTVEAFEPFTCEVIAKVLDEIGLLNWRTWLLERRAA